MDNNNEMLAEILSKMDNFSRSVSQLIVSNQERLDVIELALWGDRKDKDPTGGIVMEVKELKQVHDKKIHWVDVLAQCAITTVLATIIGAVGLHFQNQANSNAVSTPENPPIQIHNGK